MTGPRPVRSLTFGAVVALTAALICLVAPVAGSPPIAQAATILRGDRVEVPGGTTIDDDLYVAATRATIHGQITGDLLATTVFVNVVGPVGGSVTVATGRAEVRGPVGGDVRALGASIAIYGRVAGDVVVLGGSVIIVEEAEVAGSVVLLGGTLTIVRDATVGKEVRGAAVDVDIEGRVGGDVSLTARRLFVAPGAQIDGSLRYRSGSDAVIDPGAIVQGRIERRAWTESLPFGAIVLWRHAALLRLLAMLVAGAMLLWLVPRRFVAVADAARFAPLESLCLGVGLLVCLPIILSGAALSVIGLPLALVGLGSVAGALYLSQAVIGLALGRLIFGLPTEHSPRFTNLAAMTLGVVCIAGLRLIPLGGAGLLVSIATGVYGLGAIALGVAVGGSGSPGPAGTVAGTCRRETASPGDHPGLPLVRGITRFLSGYLIGLCLVAAAIAAVGVGTVTIVRLVLSLGTSVSVAMTVGVVQLVVAGLTAILVAAASLALAILVYRRR